MQTRQDYVVRDITIIPIIGVNRSKTAIENPANPFDFSNKPEVDYGIGIGLELGASQGFRTKGRVHNFLNSNQQSSLLTLVYNSYSSNSSYQGASNASLDVRNGSGSSAQSKLAATLQALSNVLSQLQAALRSLGSSSSKKV